MSVRALVIILVVVSLSIIGPVIGMYVAYFGGLIFSDDPARWGEAGDYFGGFLNPIVSFVGLIVTIYIAFYVHRLSERQGKDQIDIQKKLLKTQFEYNILTKIQDDLLVSVERINHELSQHVSFPGEPVDDLIHDLEYLRRTDSSLLQVPDEVRAKLQSTIDELEMWKMKGPWKRSVFLPIQHDIDWIMNSLFERVLATTR
jgi:uncharacterized membrane-anchored protein YhcB (DUF1043 family)